MPRTTMEDVAREAGVSRALVSLAYRNAFGVSEATRRHILEVGERLGYVHNRVAAQLATRGSSALGVFLQDLHNDLFAGLYDGIREVAEEHGRELVLAIGSRDEDRDAASLTTLQGTRVAAIVAAGLRLPDAEALTHSARTPLVAVARRIPGVDSAYSDNLVGARLATEHLLALGHRDVVFFANPPADGYRDRGRGYEAAMAGAGLRPRTVVTSYAREEVAAEAARLFDAVDPPTAVFAHNDQAALGVLDLLHARGLTPGADVSVVGYDNSSISSAPGTALTTIDLHGRDLGRAGARMAIARTSDPDAAPALEVSDPTLVVRRTTGPPPR
ncbi:LacI family DNA-binding transcriptional regulator [Microbacterium gilvum]|uniref:LacI family DNA-binding transcriptional regulator n=1 Tax=Microbacterium gilvum TaxID=1336204 RepID=A0ABP9A0G3_9MICO